MRDEASFVAAVSASPDDDVLRLAFADWLEERGEAERAEFVRVQCDLARLGPGHPRYPVLRLRELDLLARHERAWLGEWSERLVSWEFHRGLLRSVTITPGPFLREGLDLFVRHPVERVALVDGEGESLPPEAVREVVSAPAMRHVRALEVAGCRPDEPMWGMYGGRVATTDWLSALAEATDLTRLEELSLAGGTRSGREEIDPDAWRNFCRSPHLRTLRRLDLSDAYLYDAPGNLVAVMANLGRAAFAGGLCSLSFSGCYVTDEAARRLAEGPALPNLDELDLSGCDLLRTEGLRALLHSRALPAVRSLGLPYGPDLGLLASSPSVSRLRSLRLSGLAGGGVSVGIGERMEPLGRAVSRDEWGVLFRSPHLKNLSELSIGTNPSIPPEAVSALLSAPWAVNLQKLCLSSDNPMAESFRPLLSRPAEGPTALRILALPPSEGLGALLASWPGLAGVTELFFSHGEPEEAEELLRSPFLSCRLTRLDLTESCATLEGVRLLAGCAALRGLRWLGFGYNRLTPEKMTALLASPHLRHLEALHLGSESDWLSEGEVGSEEALRLLAEGDGFPRLRDVVVGSETPAGAVAALRKRFGPRLRVWADC